MAQLLAWKERWKELRWKELEVLEKTIAYKRGICYNFHALASKGSGSMTR
ncbi:MAG: hypothetical protein NC409_03470 [Clostridium sp.]|nr:hypothetical protein [Clostridium sp.]